MIHFEMIKIAYGGHIEEQNSSTKGADLSDIFLSHKQVQVLSLLQQCAVDFHRIIESQNALGWKGPLEVI